MLDLDVAREERAKARAAAREGAGATLPVRLGGQEIAVLPAEFPLTVLEPLTLLNVDIAYLVRAAAQVTAGGEARQAGLALLVDVLAANPHLPLEVIAAVKEMGRRLLGQDGYDALAAAGVTWWDARDLIKGVLGWYGVSLGESSPSVTSPESGGETLKQTSNGTTTSMPASSGPPPVPPEGLVPAG
jgi:hypothetical protein